MRLYADFGGQVEPLDNSIVTMCPNRFLQGGSVFREVATKILSIEDPIVAMEIPFLMPENSKASRKSVGMIDMVLVDDHSKQLNWCALEI